MKKYVVTLAVLFIFIFQVRPQQTCGPQTGINFSGLTGNLGFKSGNYENAFNMHILMRSMVGIDMVIPWKDAIQFSPEFNFSFEGAQFESPSPNEIREYYLTYLNIPLTFNIGLFDDPLSYYVIIGPYAGYLLGGKGRLYGTSYSSVKELPIRQFFDDVAINQPHLDFDAGIILGGGVSLNINDKQLFGEFRFQRGFIPVSKDDPTTYFKSIGANSIISLMVGCRFDASQWFE